MLDDSTDETGEIARLAVARSAAQGFDIKYLHRTDRTGYKAGALDDGHEGRARRVHRDLRRRLRPAGRLPAADGAVLHRPEGRRWCRRAGATSTADYSLLTQVQSILLDGHFVLEHGGRNRAGRFFNFNGTAGVWRREAIDDAGGWQHDTLTEDLDLSYRAQLRGWQFVFLPDLVAPAEVPVEMNAFKSQQHRWAKGSIQTCRKLLPQHPAVGPAAQGQGRGVLPPHGELQLPADDRAVGAHVPVDGRALQHGLVRRCCSSTCRCSSRRRRRWSTSTWSRSARSTRDWKIAPEVPAVADVGRHRPRREQHQGGDRGARSASTSEFARTPKYGIERAATSGRARSTTRRCSVQPFIEVALGLYFTGTVFYALANGIYGTLPFLVLFQVGFLYTGLHVDLPAVRRRRGRAERAGGARQVGGASERWPSRSRGARGVGRVP